MSNSIYHPEIIINKYKESIKVQFGGLRTVTGNSSGRGCISEWSFKSQQKMKLVLQEIKEIIVIMVRLSYPAEYPCNGRIVARHRNAFLKRLRRRGIKFFWWLEFQERGAPHIHLYIDKPIPKEELAQWWFEIVGSEDPNHLKFGTRIETVRSKDKAIGYAMSYAKKKYQKKVPDGYENVGRFWGTSEKVKSAGEYRIKFDTEAERGRWLRDYLRWYRAKMRSWGRKWDGGKRKGFMAWSGRVAWEKFIESKIKEMEVKKNGDSGRVWDIRLSSEKRKVVFRSIPHRVRRRVISM